MAVPQVQTLIFTAGVSTAVAVAQMLAAAGNFVINGTLASGGIATFDAPRRVALASNADDHTVTFTVTGTARASNGAPFNAGPAISETITIPNGTIAITNNDFATVTQVAANAATTGSVSIGTSNATIIGSGPWTPINIHITPVQMEFFLTVASAAASTCTLEFTPDDPNVATSPGGTAEVAGSGRPPATVPFPGSGSIEPFSFNPPQPWPDITIVATNVQTRSIYNGVGQYWRLTINAGLTAATIQAIQAGIRN